MIRDPALLQRAKAELSERVGSGGYRCPIPARWCLRRCVGSGPSKDRPSGALDDTFGRRDESSDGLSICSVAVQPGHREETPNSIIVIRLVERSVRRTCKRWLINGWWEV
jgi:hypothetical protein